MSETPKIEHDLSRGAPPLETVNFDLLTAYGRDGMILANPKMALYAGSDVGGQNFIGYGPLRQYLADQHEVGHRRIITAHGGMDSMDYFLKALSYQRRQQGKNGAKSNRPVTVATEVPTYDRFPKALETHDFDWEGVPFSDNGEIDLVRLRKLAQDGAIDAFYGIPEAQNPTGITYSKETRAAVEEIARETGIHILWDEAYTNLTYGGRKNEPTKDPGENVVVSRNFTKEISAGSKNGYLIVPENEAVMYDYIVSNTRLNPVYPEQAWLLEILKDPEYKEHLDFLRRTLGNQMRHFITQSKIDLGDRMHLSSEPDAGYFVETHFADVSDHDAFLNAMRQKGIEPGDSRASYHPNFRKGSNGVIRVPAVTLNDDKQDDVLSRMKDGYDNYQNTR